MIISNWSNTSNLIWIELCEWSCSLVTYLIKLLIYLPTSSSPPCAPHITAALSCYAVVVIDPTQVSFFSVIE